MEEFTLGTEIPFYSGQFSTPGGNFRFSVSGSLSAVILFDFLNPRSRPIINADYRVSFPEFQIMKEFTGRKLENILFRFVPFQHESTHIGDELTLFRKDAGFPITRINVSYESGEASLTLNDPAGNYHNNHAFTLGGRLLYAFGNLHGYYNMQAWEGDPEKFVPSKRRLEGYLRYQYDGPDGPLRIGRFYPVVSAEIRARVKYGYPYFVADPKTATGFREISEPEKYAPCLNVYAGWRDQGKSGSHGGMGGYFRLYTGINPHGQFRNIPQYTFIGVALIYEN
jgi:hypothetical protein